MVLYYAVTAAAMYMRILPHPYRHYTGLSYFHTLRTVVSPPEDMNRNAAARFSSPPWVSAYQTPFKKPTIVKVAM